LPSRHKERDSGPGDVARTALPQDWQVWFAGLAEAAGTESPEGAAMQVRKASLER